MLNIVVPMAGRGSRFLDAGYALPKPLIPIHGKPMIQVVINNLRPKSEHKFIFLCLREHIEAHALDRKLRSWAPGCEIIVVDKVTEGAACTVLLAEHLIDNSDQLMIANCDQWIDADIHDYLGTMAGKDGLIMTMWADDPKWSFVGFDEGRVSSVVEKEVISNEATVGVYNFAKGSDFVRAAREMIKKNLRVNNEFYVAPVYNELIAQGKDIGVYNIGKVLDGMYGLGTPADLDLFLGLGISRKSIDFNTLPERKK